MVVEEGSVFTGNLKQWTNNPTIVPHLTKLVNVGGVENVELC